MSFSLASGPTGSPRRPKCTLASRCPSCRCPKPAMLAGLPQAPSSYNRSPTPGAPPSGRRYVLQRMLALHFIDADTEQRSLREPINAREYAPRSDVEAPFVAENRAPRRWWPRFGEGAINAGYRAITTLDGRLQTAANRALRLGLIDYDRRHGYRGPIRRLKLRGGHGPAQLEGAACRRAAHWQPAAGGRGVRWLLRPRASTCAAAASRRSTGRAWPGRAAMRPAAARRHAPAPRGPGLRDQQWPWCGAACPGAGGAGCAGGARPAGRCRGRTGRWIRLLQQCLEPCHAGAAPARLGVQAVPVFLRPGATSSRPRA